jgi:hypothetical protein
MVERKKKEKKSKSRKTKRGDVIQTVNVNLARRSAPRKQAPVVSKPATFVPNILQPTIDTRLFDMFSRSMRQNELAQQSTDQRLNQLITKISSTTPITFHNFAQTEPVENELIRHNRAHDARLGAVPQRSGHNLVEPMGEPEGDVIGLDEDGAGPSNVAQRAQRGRPGRYSRDTGLDVFGLSKKDYDSIKKTIKRNTGDNVPIGELQNRLEMLPEGQGAREFLLGNFRGI